MPSEISADVPAGCHITFAQVLSRHGARDPTLSKTEAYSDLVQKIQDNVHSFPKKYAFLSNYSYTLGADQLTTFGQQELVNSGIKFYERYQTLTRNLIPFVRASGEDRVIESAENFTQGYHQARSEDKASNSSGGYPYQIVTISEADGSNNTLSHDLCTAFEDGPDSEIAGNAQQQWRDIFLPTVMARINQDLLGANLTATELIYMMDLCPFNTVASSSGQISKFCDLFTETEWHQYDYFQSLGKYYGYGNGNPLGPTQGVGFTNELVSRMTGQPINDHTTVNHTLDGSNLTFPIGSDHVLFADFSHDKYESTLDTVNGTC